MEGHSVVGPLENDLVLELNGVLLLVDVDELHQDHRDVDGHGHDGVVGLARGGDGGNPPFHIGSDNTEENLSGFYTCYSRLQARAGRTLARPTYPDSQVPGSRVTDCVLLVKLLNLITVCLSGEISWLTLP